MKDRICSANYDVLMIITPSYKPGTTGSQGGRGRGDIITARNNKSTSCCFTPHRTRRGSSDGPDRQTEITSPSSAHVQSPAFHQQHVSHCSSFGEREKYDLKCLSHPVFSMASSGQDSFYPSLILPLVRSV